MTLLCRCYAIEKTVTSFTRMTYAFLIWLVVAGQEIDHYLESIKPRFILDIPMERLREYVLTLLEDGFLEDIMFRRSSSTWMIRG
jgi:hypothetical protein